MKPILLVLFLFFSNSAFSQTFNWTGDGDGTNWSDQLNWDSGDGTPGNDGVPGPDNDVTITAALSFFPFEFQFFFIDITEDVSIRSLSLNSNLLGIIALNIFQNQTLSVAEDISINLAGGLFSTLTVNGTLFIDGNITETGGGSLVTNDGSLVDYRGQGVRTIFNTSYNDLVLEGNSEYNVQNTLDVNGDLVISDQTTLNLNNNDLSLAGDLINNSILNIGSSLVIFDGTSSSQSIEGTSSFTFQDMLVSNPQTVNVNTEVDLLGTLTLIGNGAFDADGDGSGIFTVRSTNVQGDARIARLPIPDNFIGNVIVERFVDANTDLELGGDFEYISIPVNGADLSMWVDDFPVTGSFSDPSLPTDDCTGCENIIRSNRSSAFFYDASIPRYISLQGVNLNNVPIMNGRGYAVFTYRDDPYVIDVTGTIGKGTINLPIESGQFNLIGNPYPSPIDGNTLMDINNPAGELNGVFYIRTANGDFASFDASSNTPVGHPNGINWAGEILMGQSFWVNSTGGTQFTFTENEKIAGGNGEFLSAPTFTNTLRVSLEGNSQDDETVIVLSENSTTSFENNLDGLKFRNGSFNSSTQTRLNLSSFNDESNIEYVFNYVSSAECFQEINLRITGAQAGDYKLNFSGLDDFSLPHDIQLIDSFLNEVIKITNLSEYNFEITNNPASFNDSRFSIQFMNNGVSEEDIPEIVSADLCNSDSISLVILRSTLNIDYSLELNDSTSLDPIEGTGRNLEVKIDRRLLADGVNTLDLSISNVQGCSQQIEVYEFFSFVIEEQPMLESFTEEISACYNGPIDIIAQTKNPSDLIRIYENIDDVEPILEVNQGTIQLPEVSKSRTYFVSATNLQSCETERIPVEVTMNEIPASPQINNLEVCSGSETTIEILNFEEGLTYRLFESIDSSEPIYVFNNAASSIELENSSSLFITAVNNTGCESERNEFTIQIINLIEPSITSFGDLLVSNRTSNNQWFRNNELLEGEINDTLVVTEEGNYFVQVSEGSCITTSEAFNFIITSTFDSFNEKIELYPNPTVKEISIRSSNNVSSISITAIDGVLIQNIDNPLLNNGEITIDLNEFESGVYLILIRKEDGERSIHRIIKN
ncbi:MAG: T9SS type A sorting domain-containing protein [Bacteroidota bacterium]